MDFKIRANFKENIDYIMRECGYRLHPKYGDSYIRQLSSKGFYPRWHVYLKTKNDILEFRIHLDQKSTSYEGSTAHSGDYGEGIVKDEAKRIISILSKFVQK